MKPEKEESDYWENKLEALLIAKKKREHQKRCKSIEENFVPKYGESYWTWDNSGVYTTSWNDDPCDIENLHLGRTFETEDEAYLHFTQYHKLWFLP